MEKLSPFVRERTGLETTVLDWEALTNPEERGRGGGGFGGRVSTQSLTRALSRVRRGLPSGGREAARWVTRACLICQRSCRETIKTQQTSAADPQLGGYTSTRATSTRWRVCSHACLGVVVGAFFFPYICFTRHTCIQHVRTLTCIQMHLFWAYATPTHTHTLSHTLFTALTVVRR